MIDTFFDIPSRTWSRIQSLSYQVRTNELLSLIYEETAITDEDRSALALELLDAMIDAYETAMITALNDSGLGEFVGGVELTDRSVLAELNAKAKEHAASIARTYNLELRQTIVNYLTANPNASEEDIGFAIQEWERDTQAYKNRQVSLAVGLWATDQGFRDILRKNNYTGGTARIEPTRAAEPRCQRLVDKGIWKLSDALRIEPPLHVNCVHKWVLVEPPKITELKWMG